MLPDKTKFKQKMFTDKEGAFCKDKRVNLSIFTHLTTEIQNM